MDFEEPLIEFTEEVDLEKFLESRCNVFTKSPAIVVKSKNFSPLGHSYSGQLEFIQSNLSLQKINVGCYLVYHERSENQKEMKFFSCNFRNSNKLRTEEQFWNDINRNPSKKITYGTDIDLAKANHSLPKSPIWDLCNLTTTLTDKIPSACDISGITKPFAYYGFPNSYFPIHREDYDLCSINYLFQGAPKIWYAFLQKDNDRIIQYMEKIFADEFEKCKEAYRHKDFLLDPYHLKKVFPDLKIFRIIQEPGDYVITGPGVYHQGFNQGFNLAYAVNIGISTWIPLLQQVKPCLCLGKGWRLNLDERKDILDSSLQTNFDVTSQHFAKFRASFFVIIAPQFEIINIQRLIKSFESKASYYLATLNEPLQNDNSGTFAIKKYQVRKRTKIRKTAPVTSLNFLISENSDYKNLLKSCLIIPYYSRSYSFQIENMVSQKFKWIPIECFKINSKILYQIFEANQWKNNQDILEILSNKMENKKRLLTNIINIKQRSSTPSQRLISIAFAEIKQEGCYQLVLVDSDGIVRVNSTFSKTLNERKLFWDQNLADFFQSNTQTKLIVFSQKLFHEIFLNDMKSSLVVFDEILELTPQSDDIISAHKKSIELIKEKTEFQYINFENMNLEGFARFLRYYYLSPAYYSPSDLTYFEECSLLNRPKKYVLSAFQSTKEWIYCIVDHNERCLFMRRSEYWKDNKGEKTLITNIQGFVKNYLTQTDDRLYHFLKPKSFGAAKDAKIIFKGEKFKAKYDNPNQEIHLIENARQFLREKISSFSP